MANLSAGFDGPNAFWGLPSKCHVSARPSGHSPSSNPVSASAASCTLSGATGTEAQVGWARGRARPVLLLRPVALLMLPTLSYRAATLSKDAAHVLLAVLLPPY